MSLTLLPVCSDQIPTAVKLAADARSDGALCVLLLPLDVAALSANRSAGKHWGKSVALKDDARLIARWAYLAAGEPRLTVPTRADLVVFRKRALDHENALLGCKAALDELIRCGLLPDDSPAWWKWDGLDWITESAFERSGAMKPWCIIVIRPREEAAAKPEALA